MDLGGSPKIKATRPKFNIALGNQWLERLEDEFPFGMTYFQGLCGYVTLWEGTLISECAFCPKDATTNASRCIMTKTHILAMSHKYFMMKNDKYIMNGHCKVEFSFKFKWKSPSSRPFQ